MDVFARLIAVVGVGLAGLSLVVSCLSLWLRRRDRRDRLFSEVLLTLRRLRIAHGELASATSEAIQMATQLSRASGSPLPEFVEKFRDEMHRLEDNLEKERLLEDWGEDLRSALARPTFPIDLEAFRSKAERALLEEESALALAKEVLREIREDMSAHIGNRISPPSR